MGENLCGALPHKGKFQKVKTMKLKLIQSFTMLYKSEKSAHCSQNFFGAVISGF